MAKRKGTVEEQEQRDRFNKIRAMLRRAWSRDPERYACLAQACRPYKGENKRQKKEYCCKKCGNWFMNKNVVVDHIKPCGALQSEDDFASFCKSLFVRTTGLQVLCKPCHQEKTNAERAERQNKQKLLKEK